MLEVVKIGGSLVTNKGVDEAPEIYEDVLLHILGEINGNVNILIFGTGAFGHARAKELGLSTKESIEQNDEVNELHSELVKYNLALAYICLQMNNLISPIFIRSMSDLDDLSENVSKILDEGSLPLLFGCLVFDDGKVKIISSDLLAAKLAEELDADELVYYSKTGGFYVDSALVHGFDASNIDRILDSMDSMVSTDASGGMRGKLEKIAEFGFKKKVSFRTIRKS